MEMSTVFWIAVAVMIVALDAWIINSVWRSRKSRATKVGWSALVLIMPVIGAGIWGIAGPRGVVEGPTSPEHSKG
ncbi:PLDc_N domain-containing protein [Pseudomonas cichorii]|uniref:PLDc_N domain-containing protein n=1 Tax=Pseudomonas cichorii TaxID=36746 RepID=UPI0018E60A51|nr:PLDc_N domain-containing protein [Pseudomonas cichorii]MBI6852707.1 PLDc_N domain-containing protein [Pseudomonas cichorii]